MTIETDRLLLRRWQASDSAPFHKMNSDPAVMEFLLKELSLEESDAMIAQAEQHLQQHGFGRWAIEVKSTGTFIGFTGLTIPAFETHFTPCVEIAWRISKDYWGQGYASEAARMALAVGFVNFKLKEIVSFTVPANTRSIAVMTRIGMKRDYDGDFEHPKVPSGHTLESHVLYRLERKDFTVQYPHRGL